MIFTILISYDLTKLDRELYSQCKLYGMDYHDLIDEIETELEDFEGVEDINFGTYSWITIDLETEDFSEVEEKTKSTKAEIEKVFMKYIPV